MYKAKINNGTSMKCFDYSIYDGVLLLYKEDLDFLGCSENNFFKAYKLKEGDTVSVEKVE